VIAKLPIGTGNYLGITNEFGETQVGRWSGRMEGVIRHKAIRVTVVTDPA
jgi:hypothetical protein